MQRAVSLWKSFFTEERLAVLTFCTSVFPGDLYQETSAEYHVGSSVERLSIIEVSALASRNEILCWWDVSVWDKRVPLP